jgi:hypothetical protein
MNSWMLSPLLHFLSSDSTNMAWVSKPDSSVRMSSSDFSVPPPSVTDRREFGDTERWRWEKQSDWKTLSSEISDEIKIWNPCIW